MHGRKAEKSNCIPTPGYCERNDIGVQKKAVVSEATAKGTP